MTRVVGRGWATVDIGRAEQELRDRVDGGFEDAERSVWLGARCRRARVGDSSDGRWLVLLEPDTEGRLAAFLARHGEGWAATWDIDEGAVPPVGLRPGPIGPETLPAGQPMSGPFRLTTSAATIEP
ncbi:MAG TPA: hypothetical protein VK867_13265 [Candidatus Limnocylindrales bacterium]|nr:hypothetical protein [Candidatus Limnocylindrales bacterium]